MIEDTDGLIRAVADALAKRDDAPVAVKHLNEAKRIVWPFLSIEDQTRRVLR